MTPRICASILPKDQLEALGLIKQAEAAEASLVEVRLDRFDSSLNLREIADSTKIPLIATSKLASEGGFFGGTENQRQQMLLEAAKNGFAYVDIDVSSSKFNETMATLKRLGAKTVVSYHNLSGPVGIGEMNRILEDEISSGACICKIVGTAKRREDNLAVLGFVAKNSSRAKLVCFLMGQEGRISRLLSPFFGAYFTFASLKQGHETATGQMTIGEMKVAYDLLGA